MKIVLNSITALTAIFFAFGTSADSKSGRVKIDGSSTVFPLTEAIAEDFAHVHPRIRVVVGSSGTGGGFKKFIRSEIDINNASRSIKASEAKDAKENGVSFIALPVAHDGITVVVNKENNWVESLTVTELTKIWQPGSKIETWKDIRPNWPDRKIKLYGPGADSGTFDFFSETINGKAQASRADYTKSEDDNVLVQGVAGDLDSLGYFAYAYYLENKTKIKAVGINNGSGVVYPSSNTVSTGKYTPLSREIYIYVSEKAAQKPEVQEFVNYYLTNAANIASDVGYIPLDKPKQKQARDQWNEFNLAAKKMAKKSSP